MDVAPRRRGPATGEHAPSVAHLGGALEVPSVRRLLHLLFERIEDLVAAVQEASAFAVRGVVAPERKAPAAAAKFSTKIRTMVSCCWKPITDSA